VLSRPNKPPKCGNSLAGPQKSKKNDKKIILIIFYVFKTVAYCFVFSPIFFHKLMDGIGLCPYCHSLCANMTTFALFFVKSRI